MEPPPVGEVSAKPTVGGVIGKRPQPGPICLKLPPPAFGHLPHRVVENRLAILAGLFWFDIPLGLLLVFIYQRHVKNELIDHLPISLNRRFIKYKYVANSTLSISGFAVIAASVAIGALSHMFWDGFTHPTGYFVNNIQTLSATINLGGHHLHLYKVLQHGSTFVGIAFIITTIWFLPKGNNSQSSSLKLYWLSVLSIMVLTIIIRLLTGIGMREYSNLIVTAMSGSMLGILFASVIFNWCRKPSQII